MKDRTRKMVMAAMFAALACVATMVIKVPTPLKGYMNLGDCIVLLAGWTLSPVYGFLAAGIGSALADVFLGYLTYAPATFLIKGLMALLAGFIYRKCSNKVGKLGSEIVGGFLAEILMIGGYYVFEGFLYGFTASLVNIPANAIQGIFGLVVGVVLIKAIEKIKF